MEILALANHVTITLRIAFINLPWAISQIFITISEISQGKLKNAIVKVIVRRFSSAKISIVSDLSGPAGNEAGFGSAHFQKTKPATEIAVKI